MTAKGSKSKEKEAAAGGAAAGTALHPGDIVYAEFEGWIAETNELFDTTNEALAKEKQIYNEKLTYGPSPLVVGKGRLFKGLDEALQKAKVGEELELTLTPDQAAGPRDPKLVELLPIREFQKQDINPAVGMEVTVKNRTGTITAVTAGRVRVDFNNRLAGRNLRYKLKVASKPENPEEIVQAILKLNYGTEEGFGISFEGKRATLKLPDVCKYDQKWLLTKYRVVSDLRECAGAETVEFIEEYVKAPEKKEKAEAEAAEEKKEAAPEAKPEAPTAEAAAAPKSERRPKAAESHAEAAR